MGITNKLGMINGLSLISMCASCWGWLGRFPWGEKEYYYNSWGLIGTFIALPFAFVLAIRSWVVTSRGSLGYEGKPSEGACTHSSVIWEVLISILYEPYDTVGVSVQEHSLSLSVLHTHKRRIHNIIQKGYSWKENEGRKETFIFFVFLRESVIVCSWHVSHTLNHWNSSWQ